MVAISKRNKKVCELCGHELPQIIDKDDKNEVTLHIGGATVAISSKRKLETCVGIAERIMSRIKVKDVDYIG